MSKGRRKSKTNRFGICFCCGDKIQGKDRNAEYCEECSKLIRQIKRSIYQTIHYFKKRHKKYDITVERKLNITIKKKVINSQKEA